MNVNKWWYWAENLYVSIFSTEEHDSYVRILLFWLPEGFICHCDVIFDVKYHKVAQKSNEMMLERQQNHPIELKIYTKKYVLLLFDSASAINFVKPLACQRRYSSTILISATLYTFIFLELSMSKIHQNRRFPIYTVTCIPIGSTRNFNPVDNWNRPYESAAFSPNWRQLKIRYCMWRHEAIATK